jgi:hypothetical protein
VRALTLKEADMRSRIAAAALALVLVGGPALAESRARTHVILEWNTIMLNTLSGQNPFAQARFAAIVQLSVFEAVNACTGRYEPYLGGITAPAGASSRAAAVAAAHAVLKNYFPAQAAALDAARAQSLAGVPNGASKQHGILVGEAAAAAMIAARVDDGATPPQTFLPASTAPGVWQPTPPVFGPGILFHWRELQPFGIRSSSQFRSAPPPPLASKRYARDFNEVMTFGSATSTSRPQYRSDVARFFAVVGAVDAWNPALAQVIARRRMSLTEIARAFALLNMAISDGLVSSMDTKYTYQFWRPATAIPAGAVDGNRRTDGDANWLPFITTPAFPSYPSAHASASYAARAVIEDLLGFKRARFVLSHPGAPGVQLAYDSFRDLTADIDDARVYGGIHFRFDQEAGALQGRRVGRFVTTHQLRPIGRR